MGPLKQKFNGNKYVGLDVCALTKYVETATKTTFKNKTF